MFPNLPKVLTPAGLRTILFFEKMACIILLKRIEIRSAVGICTLMFKISKSFADYHLFGFKHAEFSLQPEHHF